MCGKYGFVKLPITFTESPCINFSTLKPAMFANTKKKLQEMKDNGEELLGYYYQSAIEAYIYDNPDVFYIEFSKLYLNIRILSC